MQDFLLVSFSLIIFSIIGFFPTLLLPKKDFKERFIISPVVGFGTTGVVLSIFYRFGIQPEYSLITIFSFSVSSLTIYLLKNRNKLYFNNKKNLIYFFTISVTLMLCILPKLIGDRSISIIQGVPSDFLNYIVDAYVYQNYSYNDISNVYTDVDNINMYNQFLYFGKISLEQRPTVSITLGAISKFFFKTNSLAAYSYMVLMQINILFISIFTLINIFNTRTKLVLIISISLTIGFYQQFVFDIDAWSELSSLPLSLLSITTIVIFFHSSQMSSYFIRNSTNNIFFRYSLFNALILTSLLYYYPEILFTNLCSITFMVILNCILTNNTKILFFKLLSIFISFVFTIILGSLFYHGSLGYFIQLVKSFFSDVHYHDYPNIGFFAFIMGRDFGQNNYIFNDFITFLYNTFCIPIDVIISFLGLNFLVPKFSFGIVPNIATRIIYYFFCFVLIYCFIKSIICILIFKLKSKQSLFYTASLGALLIPLTLLYKHNYWVSGKAMTYAFNFIFFMLLSPLLIRFEYIKFKKISKIMVYIYIFSYLSFGFLRPISATHKYGNLYSFPYPGDPVAHKKFTWDIESIVKSTKNCSMVGIDIDNISLQLYTENFIDDYSKNIFNLSRSNQMNPLWIESKNSQKSFWLNSISKIQKLKIMKSPDCLITTNPLNKGVKIKKIFNLLRNP